MNRNLEHCSDVSIITQGQKNRSYTVSELKAISNGFTRCERLIFLMKLRVTHTARILGGEMTCLIGAIT